MKAADPNHLDIGEAFRFPFRSKGWLWKFLLLDLCAFLSFTVVGLFVFYGYLVEVSRHARSGDRELPSWDRLGEKLHDGLLFNIALLIWFVPLLILYIVWASTARCTSSESGESTCISSGMLSVLLLVASYIATLVLFLLIPAILAQLLAGGRLTATLNVAAVFRRAAFKPALTVVVLLLYIPAFFVLVAGLVGLLVGVLITYPYAFVVVAHLYGQFARITDPTVRPPQLSD